eukprot:m51a1_g9092 putative chitinase (636) ;mRNA; f:58099-60177
MRALCALCLLLAGSCCALRAPTSCQTMPAGYYCTSATDYVWCYGQQEPGKFSCPSPLQCKCGWTSTSPCEYASGAVTPCLGTPGEYDDSHRPSVPVASSEGSAGSTSSGLYTIKPTSHMPLVLRFEASAWKQQLGEVLAWRGYDDGAAYAPEGSRYQCAFHPGQRYDANPTQLWIGRPTATTSISYTPGVTLRLPDKWFGMFLGYAMDHYGLNPGALMGLGAKESFAGVAYKDDAEQSLFLVSDPAQSYDCFAAGHRGLCSDANKDGPFQVEAGGVPGRAGGMSSDVSVFAQRFWTGDAATPKAQRRPSFTTDNEIMAPASFRALHDSYTLDFHRAVVLTALDFHFRHNLLMQFTGTNFLQALEKRASDRQARDSLEFAAAMYTYNRGVFDKKIPEMLGNCGPTQDPAKECQLNGFGGHTVDIRAACLLVDQAPANEVYDYDISWPDVQAFLAKLEGTYPYESVDGLYGRIDWDAVRSDAREAFDAIARHRSAKTPGKSSVVSFRYDWRTLLAVVRMRLPPRETLVGPSAQSYVKFWGGKLNKDLGPYVAVSAFPFAFCTEAGGAHDVCSGSSPVPDPRSSSDKRPEHSSGRWQHSSSSAATHRQSDEPLVSASAATAVLAWGAAAAACACLAAV